MIECIVGLVIFFIAYELGRRRGWQEGFAQAEALAPLRLRQESLESGRCLICSSSSASCLPAHLPAIGGCTQLQTNINGSE